MVNEFPEIVRHLACRSQGAVGVVEFSDHEASQDDIHEWADTAMYETKGVLQKLERKRLPNCHWYC